MILAPIFYQFFFHLAYPLSVSRHKPTMPPNDPVPVKDGEPKRVILRLRYGEFEDDDVSHTEAIDLYLKAIGRQADTYSFEGQHCPHVEPRQDYALGNPRASFHITLDMEWRAVTEPDMDKVPHEMYRVRRGKDGTLTISRLPDHWLRVARRYTDPPIGYRWGKF